MSISIHYILIWCFQKCIFSRGEECKCRKKSSHNVHLLVLVHNISRLYVEVGDHNLVLAPTSILAVIYSSELEKVSLDFWSGVVVFLIRHHHVTFKSSELERYACMITIATLVVAACFGTERIATNETQLSFSIAAS